MHAIAQSALPAFGLTSERAVSTRTAYRPGTYWHNIQVLRLIATFAIVYIHLKFVFDSLGIDPRVLDTFRAGTDLFLVIAGFLSVHVLNSPRRTAGSYIVSRVVRIVPLYWIFTLLAFLAQNYAMSHHPHTLSELAQSFFFIPYGEFPILYPTWTLTIILEFSIIVALCRAIDMRGTAYLSAAVTISLVLFGMAFDFEQPALEMYTHPMLLDFALGALLYEWRLDARFGEEPRRAIILGAALVCICAVLILLRQFAWPEIPRFVAAGVPVGGLLLGTTLLERGGCCLSAYRLQKLAKCSYAIYLTHWFWDVCVEKEVSIAQSSGMSVLLLIVTPFAVSIVAVGVFKCLETPISNTLSSWFASSLNGDTRSKQS